MTCVLSILLLLLYDLLLVILIVKILVLLWGDLASLELLLDYDLSLHLARVRHTKVSKASQLVLLLDKLLHQLLLLLLLLLLVEKSL